MPWRGTEQHLPNMGRRYDTIASKLPYVKFVHGQHTVDIL